MVTSDSTTENGPISTSRPILALGLTAAQGLIFPDCGAKKSLLLDGLPTEIPLVAGYALI